ncbi:MAG: sulfatase-like hydrolase/transferase, partial [bacterium]|nr:sulfatase-like hydrolase/transferase [bacterium]
MTRRSFLAFPLSIAAAQSNRTNVVFILTDDQGHWALDAGGRDDCDSLATPNLARLARQGTRFSNAFVCTPVCSPSRMTFLTGRIPSQHGVQDWLLPSETYGAQARSYVDGQPTLSRALADQGYATGLCGKWHLGDDARPQAGFQYWSTVPGGGGAYRDPEFAKNGQRIRRQGYKTDLLGDDAIEFIEQNRERPFFLFLSLYAPHTPLRYQAERYREPYRDSQFSCFPDLPVHPFHMREMNGRVSGHLRDFSKRHSKLSYSALVTGIDHTVGRVLAKLDELGLRENTLVVFTSDHGFHTGHEGIWGKGNGTVPFNLYERSVRIPLIWSHPG